MPPMSMTRMRLERLVDERAHVEKNLEDGQRTVEDEQRDPSEFEAEQFGKWRTRLDELDQEIDLLAGDLERVEKTRDVSQLLRAGERQTVELPGSGGGDDGPVIYRTFAAYARDALIVRYPLLAAQAAHGRADIGVVTEAARDRLERMERALQNTTSDLIGGLTPPAYMAQILDIINTTRPVVATARAVNLDSGKLTYPRILQRPTATKQGAEKTQGGTANMQVTLDQLVADTFIGGGDLSWQTINWSTPDALALWFELAGEAYARQTETAACSELGTTGGGTITVPLGTTGTESFQQWRAAILAGITAIYANTGGRAATNTLYLAAQRFFQLAGLGTDQVIQMSAVGNLDIATLTGTYAGLRVVGSYGFPNLNAAVVGDSSAFLVGETAGAPVELRTVEPSIGGMEVGVIGAFKSKVFDAQRFIHLS